MTNAALSCRFVERQKRQLLLEREAGLGQVLCIGREMTSNVNIPVIRMSQDAHQLVEQANRRATKIRAKAAVGGIFGRIFELFDRK